MTEEEIQFIMQYLPNGEEKRGIFTRLRDKLPSVPKWMTFEEHVKTVRLHIKNDLVEVDPLNAPGTTPAEKQALKQQEQE